MEDLGDEIAVEFESAQQPFLSLRIRRPKSSSSSVATNSRSSSRKTSKASSMKTGTSASRKALPRFILGVFLAFLNIAAAIGYVMFVIVVVVVVCCICCVVAI
ncbi:uncharacterized protein AMSG_07045 [Thecamonas trahens ATCC 50062]|uniref:Transmembrane protein n=1 Tax=Thecamonas trahens ATCC 50062 TaxID=461836 RepID=A0A0L0DG24_THETB|nr:hypothetical protein AMSG_07045 [Thecamonas trahens ATCC 50062]KNC51061.1 hypothetical protein AMSG_07045 [Thecamonas trahens ATCC 50062]|eukprot:XP_013756522.1 hypothetical protein AMSG_07045 [Thecamonas trahens ATCC 50062]